MTHVVVLNVALFVPVVLGGLAASWLGWMLAGRGEDGDGGSGLRRVSSPISPDPPRPVEPRVSAGPHDLARSA